MGPESRDSQGQPSDPDEPILVRIERDHRRIVNFYLEELGAAQESSRIRELLDPLPEMLSKHFADEEGPDGLYDGLRAIRPSLDSELKSLRREDRRLGHCAQRAVPFRLTRFRSAQHPGAGRAAARPPLTGNHRFLVIQGA